MRKRRFIQDISITFLLLILFFCLSLFVENVFRADSIIPAMFTLAVFLISLKTDGYLCGIVASLASVLALNYAFAFPYFKFNFSIQENLVTAVIMLIITIVTSALTTKLRQQEKMRAESAREKMRANLLRAVSHDLRTPLTTIYGSSSTIIDNLDDLNREQLLRLVGGIKEDAEWLMRMVENLLSVTKLNSGNVKVKKTQVVLEELIDTALVRFKKNYPSQTVQVHIPDDFVMIPMDAVLIEQVIVNILENAVHHAKGMENLELRVSVKDTVALFEIIDDGCGISKEDSKDIFTGYLEQKNAPVDNQKSSMGIGLSVCASIVRAHEGEIGVENRKEGGCRFYFSLNGASENNE